MFKLVVRSLVELHKPKLMVIFEPRISGNTVHKVIRSHGFPCSHRVEAMGFSCGIWILWRDQEIEVEILANTRRLIHCKISWGGSSTFFSTIYANPSEKIGRQL